MFHQSVSETHYRRTLILCFHLQRIQRFPNIAHGDVLVDKNFACISIHLSLERGAVDLIERWRSTKRMIAHSWLAHPAMPDQFPAPSAQLAGNEFGNRHRAIWKIQRAVHYLNLSLGKAKKVLSHLAQLLVDVLAGASDGVAH